MALSIYEAAQLEITFTGDDGFTVMARGEKSAEFEGGYHMYAGADGAYLGLIIRNAERKTFLVYDANGTPLDKRYKTALGATKRLYRIRQDSLAISAASAPSARDEVVAQYGESAAVAIEEVLDRLAESLALSGPVIERLRKSAVDDEPAYSAGEARCAALGLRPQYV